MAPLCAFLKHSASFKTEKHARSLRAVLRLAYGQPAPIAEGQPAAPSALPNRTHLSVLLLLRYLRASKAWRSVMPSTSARSILRWGVIGSPQLGLVRRTLKSRCECVPHAPCSADEGTLPYGTQPAFLQLPGVESVEAVQECAASIFGEVRGRYCPRNVAEQCVLTPVLFFWEQCSPSTFRLLLVSTVSHIRPYSPNQVHSSVLTLLRGQFAVPGAAESPLALRLAALPESLELCRTTSPLFTATLADTMLALRLFSFS